MQGSRLLLHEGDLIPFVSPLLTPTLLVTTSAADSEPRVLPIDAIADFSFARKRPGLKPSGPQGEENVES